MLDWLDKAQIRENPKHYGQDYRHRSKGAWAFSTPEQSYTVSDLAVVEERGRADGRSPTVQRRDSKLSWRYNLSTPQRMHDCIDTLLSMQNPSGGFASYELQRGSERMEYLNAAEVFGNIMVDYMYPE